MCVEISRPPAAHGRPEGVLLLRIRIAVQREGGLLATQPFSVLYLHLCLPVEDGDRRWWNHVVHPCTHCIIDHR